LAFGFADSVLAAAFGFAGSVLAAAFGFAGSVLAAAFGFAAAFGAEADPPTELNALSATLSSTLDAAALASTPAALRAASSSLLVTPADFAIS
jgi:hypothetical protein